MKPVVRTSIVIGCAGLACGLWLALRSPSAPHVSVHVLDVGQGDAIYIRAPGGFDVLIDGGSDNRVIEQLGEVMPFYDRDIDLLIPTHPDADHITGLVAVFDRFTVRRVWWSGYEGTTATYRALQERIEAEHATLESVTAGRTLAIGAVTIRVVYPLVPPSGKENPNDTSVSVRLSYGDQDVLLTGDLELAGEEELVRSGQVIDAEVLKAGHHGSKSSTGDLFLDAVRPEVAVLSVGEGNTFGHPHSTVVSRLNERSITIARTDCQGRVTIDLFNDNYTFLTERDDCAESEP